jgi:TPR repeat protein
MRFAFIASVLIAFCSATSWADATDDVRKKAESGDAAAQFELAQIYLREASNARSERRKLRDLERAVDWFSKSAEQDFARAQFRLGRMYLLGRGVTQDKSLGVDWQVKAAEQGLAEAQFEIGHRYLYGGILEQDIDLALDMFTKAANQRYVDAQKQLGILYFEGDVVAPDLIQSHLWFSVAALNDDRAAQGYLPMLESIMDEAQVDEARALAAQWQADYMDE